MWKHESEKRCAIPTDHAKRGLACGIGKCRKLRKNSRFRVIVHSSFETTHNLKVTGSNPVPATKKITEIKQVSRWYSNTTGQSRVYINATSTPNTKNCTEVHRPTAAGIGRQCCSGEREINADHHRCSVPYRFEAGKHLDLGHDNTLPRDSPHQHAYAVKSGHRRAQEGSEHRVAGTDRCLFCSSPHGPAINVTVRSNRSAAV